jgi:hypothetical protein
MEHPHGGEGTEKEDAESVLETTQHGEVDVGGKQGGLEGERVGVSVPCQPAEAG